MNIKTLKEMVDQPASKEWFKKYGTPKAVTNHPLKKKMSQKMVGKGYVNAERAYALYMNNWKHDNPDEFKVGRSVRKHNWKDYKKNKGNE